MKNILIEGLEDIGIDGSSYNVINGIMYEEISNVSSLELTIYTDKNIWDINIPVNKEVKVTFNGSYKEYDSNIELKRKFRGVIIYVNKGTSFFHEQNKKNIQIPYITLKIFNKFFLLTFFKKYKIFKEISIREIIEKIVKEHNVKISFNTTKLDTIKVKMLIQYGETDYNFICRLIQFYGCYYICHNGHEEGEIHSHIHIYDGHIGYDDSLENSGLIINEELKKKSDKNRYKYNLSMNENSILNIEFERQLLHRRYRFTDYDHTIPLKISCTYLHTSEDRFGEYHSYPSHLYSTDPNYREDEVAHNYSRINREYVYKCISNILFMYVGKKIHIENLKDIKPQLVIKTIHKWTKNFSSKNNGKIDDTNIFNENYDYLNEFYTTILHDERDLYIGSKYYMKPKVEGMELAEVVSTVKGEEIDVKREMDQQLLSSEVLIKFCWTLDDELDPEKSEIENRSCWVPVGQSLAGKSFGSYIIPRVGDMVLVHFLNNDPDRPIVYGSIHNMSNMTFPITDTDKYKMFLMRSHTFHGDVRSSSEISINDEIEKENINIQSQKDIYGTCKRGGKCKLKMEDGDYILEVGGEGPDSGSIHIKNDGTVKWHSIKKFEVQVDDEVFMTSKGKFHINSDTEIKLTSPKINAHGDKEVYIEGGEKITMETIEIKAHGKDKIEMKGDNEINIHGDNLVEIKSKEIKNHGSEKIEMKGDNEINIHGNNLVEIKSKEIKNHGSEKIEIKSSDSMDIHFKTIHIKGDVIHIEGTSLIFLKSEDSVKILSSLKTLIHSDTSVEIKSTVKIHANADVELTLHSGTHTKVSSDVKAEIGSPKRRYVPIPF